MHGLGPHGEDHSAGHLPGGVALVAAEDSHASHDPAAAASDTAVVPEMGASNGSAPNEEGGVGLGECLALLGLLFAFAIGVVLLARRRRPRFIARWAGEVLELLGRPPDPPCPYRLSILRC